MDARFQRLSQVAPAPTAWLWPNLVPFGAITVLDGDPGLGKSLVTEYLAVAVATGSTLHGTDVSHDAAGVILLQAEEPATTLRANLVAAGLFHEQFDRVLALDRDRTQAEPIELPESLPAIEEAITEIGARLLVVDPITAFMGGSVNNDQSVRQSLTPLAAMAERLEVAVVLVRHLSKKAAGLFTNRFH